jgi:glycosyltransferase involved in cell wall biosynthesis
LKLLIDGQCIQSTSSLRGIGRYALSLTRALVQEAGQDHQVEVLLNGGDDPGRLLRARTALEGFLPAGRIHVFDAHWPWTPPYDDRRRPAAEAAHAAAVHSLTPDALLIGSPFEGDGENVLTVHPEEGGPPTAAVLYDLIPALDPDTYLMGPGADVYWRRFAALERCDALLAISQHSAAQALRLLGERCPPTTPVWGGPYPSGDFPVFEPQHDDQPELVLPQRFVLSVGGDHPRKNLDRLVSAWARVPAPLRQDSPLVIACRLNTGTVRRLRRIGRRAGLSSQDVVLTGGVSEATLHRLYRQALGFVFPSVEEGLGMPPLEAMAVGCPTLLAQGSSLSELSDDGASFFDGFDVDDMSSALVRLLGQQEVRDALRRTGNATAARFTWRRTARLAWGALEALEAAPTVAAARGPVVQLSDGDAIKGLVEAPGPVLVDVPLPVGPPGETGLPVAPRAALAPATALVVPTQTVASDVLRAGMLDHPVLLDQEHLTAVAVHDFHAAYARGLALATPLNAELAEGVVRAALQPARWTLQRPRPVWLLLIDGPADPALEVRADAAGVDLVQGRLRASALAGSADVVLVRAPDLEKVRSALEHARRRGALVVVLHPAAAPTASPAWCEDVVLGTDCLEADSWSSAVLPRAATWGRTTGWPWRDRA